MRVINFSLPVKKDKEGKPDPEQTGLYFLTYKMYPLKLMPGDSIDMPIRDTPQGLYADWSDQDIVDYYNNLYGDVGLVTKVSGKQ